MWIRAQGTVEIACHDGNGQAIGLAHSSWIALDGFTVGPASGFYPDSAVHIGGVAVHPEDPAHYGEWLTSDHVIIRGLTARNLNRGPDGDSNPDQYESACCDGVKSNQAEYVWILDSTVSRTARHGFDHVGVHHAAICRNTLSDMVGAGVGMEAKGGSSDILFERNRLRRVRTRGIVLGGEGTDNVFMFPWDAGYEATRVVARDNVIVNAIEGGLSFNGCQGCAAVANSVWFTPGFAAADHDLLRMYPSVLEGAGSEWGGPRRVGEVLASSDNRVVDNLFGAPGGDVTCPLNAGDGGVARLSMHHNLWWNGSAPLPACGTGVEALEGYPDPASSRSDPKITASGDPANAPDLTPLAGSPLAGAGAADPAFPAVDLAGRPRPSPPAIGALEPR